LVVEGNRPAEDFMKGERDKKAGQRGKWKKKRERRNVSWNAKWRGVYLGGHLQMQETEAKKSLGDAKAGGKERGKEPRYRQS